MPDPVQLGPITVTVEEAVSEIVVEEIIPTVVVAPVTNTIIVNDELPDNVYVGSAPIASGGDQIISFTRSNLLTATAGQGRFIFPHAAVLVKLEATVANAPEGADIILQLVKNGTINLFDSANRPRILEDESIADDTSAFTNAYLQENDYLTLNIDQVGSVTPGDYLTVVLVYRKL